MRIRDLGLRNVDFGMRISSCLVFQRIRERPLLRNQASRRQCPKPILEPTWQIRTSLMANPQSAAFRNPRSTFRIPESGYAGFTGAVFPASRRETRYALINGSRSPSSTRSTSPTSYLVR